jgi:hypothetical protein
MPNTEISNLFEIQNRFLRSAHLERDFKDPSALNSYVLTPQSAEYLERLTSGLKPQSGQRAWRITGDYGSGKSSFGLVLAHLLSEKRDMAPAKLQKAINFEEFGISAPRLFPLLITGSREALSIAILRSLYEALTQLCSRGRTPKVFERIDSFIKNSFREPVEDETIVEVVLETNAYIINSGKAGGLLIILDELGKFLEFAALNPDRQDVYLLQKLGEAAARSGEKTILLIGLLHQGFNAYADQLSQSVQREWDKIAGRFELLVFDQPLEQTAGLIADALNVKQSGLTSAVMETARREMKRTLDLGWYGARFNQNHLIELAPRLYPLHPTLLPVLLQIFRRFGQNERSLFSFLLSNEPFGLQEFAKQSVDQTVFYRLHNLYDYARAVFGHQLTRQSYRSHWNLIDSMINSFQANHANDLKVLKTIGLLNMLDDNSLLASEEIVRLGVDDISKQAAQTAQSIKHLQKDKRVIYHRGAAGGFCLWPHTSVNLEKAYEEAIRAVGNILRVSSVVRDYLETRPLVARRHYIETGNMRHFSVRYLPVTDLESTLEEAEDGADGTILVALCETEEERRKALSFAHSATLAEKTNVLFAVPKPLSNLAGLVLEVQRWRWIEENTPELKNDSYAQQEVTRQITISRQSLEKRIQYFIGLQFSLSETGLQWFLQGDSLQIENGRGLLATLSDICDEVYKDAPKIQNELVNRHALSSAAAGARMRLIERMFKFSSEPLLGMDPNKKPPEMSMYLSVLENAKLHQESGEFYALVKPKAEHDQCNVGPTLDRIKEILEASPDGRIKVSEILDGLKHPPFGLRAGLSPIMLAVFTIIYEQYIAFYEDGAFLRHVGGFDFQRLIKAPETFEMQFCKVAGVRKELFKKLMDVLQFEHSDRTKINLLDIVRPLLTFVAQLPEFTHKTKKLSRESLQVREAVLSASEPVKLLFKSLPEACGYSEFPADEKQRKSDVIGFVNALKSAMDELKAGYPDLQARMKTAIIKSLDVQSSSTDVRDVLSKRATVLLTTVTDLRLKGFCQRLTDFNLPEAEWMESFGSFVCSKPPSKWSDSDEELYSNELMKLALKFKRLESMTFSPQTWRGDSAVRVAITHNDGAEFDKIIFIDKEQELLVTEIEAKIRMLIKQGGRAGFAAAARAFSALLKESDEEFSNNLTENKLPF